MNDLIKDEEVLSQVRADAFVPKETSIRDVKLRPFTAGSLLICKKVGNKLITGGESENPEFDILSFIYIHSAPIAQVRVNSYSKEKFWGSVLEWADKLKVTDLEEAGKMIEEIISSSGLAIASPKDDGKSSGGESPN
jgi:hypothetical protein